jgi:succinate dehydrogenase / fumarate reductase cytochrome b subunit
MSAEAKADSSVTSHGSAKLNKLYFLTTIGRKQMMAVAGLIWAGFVLSHALGNLLIFVGPEAYNKYGHAIVSNPAIYVAEVLLVVMLLLHVITSVVVTVRNKMSKNTNYKVVAKGPKATSAQSKTMMEQGLVVLGFIIIHLITFKYGANYQVEYNGVIMRDLFVLVFEAFQNNLYVLWYCFALVILSFHLSHGVYSALQTLGLHHPRFMKKVKCASVVYGVVVAVTFISQPIYLRFFFKGF